MRLSIRERTGAHEERDAAWERWFAWFPVRVGAHDVRWLEYVERKRWGFSPKVGYVFARYRSIEYEPQRGEPS